MSHDIMVRKRPHGPAIRRAFEKLFQFAPKERRRILISHQLERIALVQPTRRCVFAHHPNGMMIFAHLAHRRAVGVTVQQPPDAFHPRQVFRLVFREQVILHAIRVGFGNRLDPEIGGIVAQPLIVEKVIHCVKPKAVNAALQPEPHVFNHPILHIRVVKVPIRLLHQKVVQVILLAARVPGPG